MTTKSDEEARERLRGRTKGGRKKTEAAKRDIGFGNANRAVRTVDGSTMVLFLLVSAPKDRGGGGGGAKVETCAILSSDDRTSAPLVLHHCFRGSRWGCFGGGRERVGNRIREDKHYFPLPSLIDPKRIFMKKKKEGFLRTYREADWTVRTIDWKDNFVPPSFRA